MVQIIAGFLISILIALVFYIMGTRLGKQIEEYAQFFIYDKSERAERQRKMVFNLAIALLLLLALFGVK